VETTCLALCSAQSFLSYVLRPDRTALPTLTPSQPFSLWWELTERSNPKWDEIISKASQDCQIITFPACSQHISLTSEPIWPSVPGACHPCPPRGQGSGCILPHHCCSSILFPHPMRPECCHSRDPGCPSTQGTFSLTQGATTPPFMPGCCSWMGHSLPSMHSNHESYPTTAVTPKTS
jgi:hypothetical protein